ncbi:MAG: ABC transporter permease [Endomicrobium sp.]|nr:ABC transporter permease [Endomicrobium sp.]
MSIMPVELFIALRYLKSRKKSLFSFTTTLIAIGGTALGVAALVITLAVMSGFQNDIRDKILGIQPHVVITRVDSYAFKDYKNIEDIIKKNSFVKNVLPFIYKQGVIRGQNTSSSGIIIKAIDYKRENDILNLSKQIVSSGIHFSSNKIGEHSIILGQELAKSIFVSSGDDVILMFPESFTSLPKMYKFKVVGIIKSGIYDFDTSLGFIDLQEGQRLLNIGDAITGLGVYVKSLDKTAQITSLIAKSLAYPYKAKSWIDMNKNLFYALRLEKIMMFLILGLIILIAAFNIVSNLLLLSVQKAKEIGIMSAVGFSKFSISKIFFYEGITVGLVGTFLGIVFGLTVSFALKYLDIFKLPKGVYYVDKLPVSVMAQDVIFVALSAFVITVLAGIYPAYQVSKLDPLEAIRFG